MQGKSKSARGIALLATSAALIVAMALALPALAHNDGGHHFGDRDPAGTIASFDQGTRILTIDLADGGSISGLVTRWTWIDAGDDRCDRDDRRDRRQLHGDWCRRQLHQFGDDRGHHFGRGSADDLVGGAVVDDAVLGLTDGRAFFVKVDLDD